MIDVPVILALRFATAVYRNRKLIAQGIQAIRTNQGANEEGNQAAKFADPPPPHPPARTGPSSQPGRAREGGTGGILNGVTEVPQPEFLVPPVRIDGPVKLADPDPAWADWYAQEEDRIRRALGERAVQIQHVGSTSVPGLAAKPVIDIVLVVADSADEASYVPDLEAVGYRLRVREPSWYEHRFLVDEPTVQIHVFTTGTAEVERMLLFRNRLRNSPADRELYQRTKRELAAGCWSFIQDYADAKSSVVDDILTRARADPH